MKYGLDIRQPNNGNDYYSFDSFFQIAICSYEKNPQLFAAFEKCINLVSFNFNIFIDYAIKKIAENRSNKEAFINGLLSIGILKDLNIDDKNCCHMKTKSDSISFYSADKFYNQYPEILSYIGNIEGRKNDCHKNALFLLQYLKKGEVLTAYLKNEVNVEYYHSFYKSDGMIVDFNNNVVMPEDDYIKVYNPKIISVVNYKNFDEKYNQVKQNTTKRTTKIYPILAIASYQEYQKDVNI